jgi:hypothetical protein
MRISVIAIWATVGLVALAGQSGAQQNQSGFTPQQLDEMSKQRQEQIGPRNWGPPPPQSSIPKDTILPTKDLWVCMSTDAYQPVFAEPSTKAPVIGQTLTQVAVSGPYVDGFAKVLHYNGKVGYVPKNDIRPFKSEIKAGLSCSISGVRPNGTPVFDIH